MLSPIGRNYVKLDLTSQPARGWPTAGLWFPITNFILPRESCMQSGW